MILKLRTHSAARLRDELTAPHTALRLEAAMCLRAVTAISDDVRSADVDRAVGRFREFLNLASGYCESRRTSLWPALARSFPAARVELMLLANDSLALKSDLSAVDRALDGLLVADHLARDDRAAVGRAALDAVRPAKILHDSLSLHLGNEELVLGDLLDGSSREQIVRAQRAVRFAPHTDDRG